MLVRNVGAMIIQTFHSTSLAELAQILEGQFSNCSVYLFNSQPKKTIIVRKSATVGAQITVSNNEVRIDACFPHILLSGIVGFLCTIFPVYHHFELEITDFLRTVYR